MMKKEEIITRRKVKSSKIGISYALILVSLLAIILSTRAYALPPLPTEIYGEVIYFNQNASPGVVRAYVGTTLCGEFVMTNNTFYGLLDCVGDDPSTPEKEGGVQGDTIRLTYNGIEGDEYGNITWESGTFKYIKLIVPILYCGDTFCDFRETCSSCPQDCGACPPAQGGAGAGAAGAGGISAGGYGGIGGITPLEALLQGCTENWDCTEWSECTPAGFQYRNCTDLNDCGTTKNKPPEVKECEYIPSCENGIKDPGEEGIDCGGPCKPCATCYDGIKNCHDGACEQGIDCGGPCKPCASCYDGIKNCHDGACEQDVDCGGPCKPCPKPFIEMPALVCEKSFRKLMPWAIYFFTILFGAIFIRGIHDYKKVNFASKKREKIKEKIEKRKEKFDEKGEQLFKEEISLLKYEWTIKKKFWLFSSIVIVLGIVVILFYYFFGMCPPYSLRIFLLFILALIFIPLTVYSVLRIIEYSEEESALRERKLVDVHYSYLLNLLEKEMKIIKQKEDAIEKSLMKLSKSKEFRSLLVDSHIKEQLRRLADLFVNYKDASRNWNDISPIKQEVLSIKKDSKFISIKRLATLLDELLELLDHYMKARQLNKDISDVEEEVISLLGNKGPKHI